MQYIKNNNITPKKVNTWKGTSTNSKNNLLYKFNASLEFKELLLEFENFFIIDKKEISKNTYSCSLEETDWGKSDIAFYDEKNEIISFIIAHEGDVLVSKKYMDEFERFKMDDRITYYFGLGWVKKTLIKVDAIFHLNLGNDMFTENNKNYFKYKEEATQNLFDKL